MGLFFLPKGPEEREIARSRQAVDDSHEKLLGVLFYHAETAIFHNAVTRYRSGIIEAMMVNNNMDMS